MSRMSGLDAAERARLFPGEMCDGLRFNTHPPVSG